MRVLYFLCPKGGNLMEDRATSVCLDLVNIKKDYMVDKKPFTAIHDLSCRFPKKGFVAILGHSGSGKTTLLNIIGGLDHYTEGDMIIDGRSTKNYKAKDWDNYRNKRVGFVFQSYNLIPHLTVLQNVEMSLKLGGVSVKKREAKAIEVLTKVGLEEYLKKKPNQLSGGQMQRVAIARALVNDPDIILADEPTGALDSTTSVQVMDLIKEVGKDRCVIMVTHNQELASAYADRIIEMKDGTIVSDTAPLGESETVEAESAPQSGKKERTSMSFLTALHSSSKNILTKKGRTAMTAIACSFGIIGVALVLATSNGFSQYVHDVEVSLASSVPISISPTASQIAFKSNETYEEFPSDGNVRIYDPRSSAITTVRNELSQEYFNYIDRIMTDPTCEAYGAARSIMYNRKGLNFHFLVNAADKKIRTIDQYEDAGITGSIGSGIFGLPSTIIHELYGDENNLSALYDTIEGRFPKAIDEMAIVLDKYNRIDFDTMRKLGFFGENEKYTGLSEQRKRISFSEILYKAGDENNPDKRTFKCYRNSDYYQLPSNPDDLDAMLETVDLPSYNELKVTRTGDPSTKDLSVKLSAVNDNDVFHARCVREPSATDVYNDTTNKYKPINMKIVGVLRPTEKSYIALMPSSLAYTPQLTQWMAGDIVEGTTAHKLGKIQAKNWYVHRETDEAKKSTADGLLSLNMAMEAICSLINDYQTKDFGEAALAQLQTAISSMTSSMKMVSATGYTTSSGNPAIKAFSSISGFLGNCRNLGAEFPKVNVEDILMNLMASSTTQAFISELPNNIMQLVAYTQGYSLVTSVLIFPASLTTKETLHKYLDQWNDLHPNNQIVYSDVMDSLMGSLGTLIQVISAVLIVFASISLVVSSVMTAIITYVSVVERTKEIGVLRACGARKRDVSRLFQAECIIIGAIAGLIGVAFTALMCIPINLTLNHLFPGNGLSSIASLNPWHALALLGISILLALISSLIPASIAAKRDPVVCLRTE